ncbi:MAG: hypothetical protein HC830_12940 [Bacteroidetes bacterium]|nr:hypothetical protein [Bacteroidota bacterium]
MEYSEDSNFGSTETGTNAVINLTPGTDLYFRKKQQLELLHLKAIHSMFRSNQLLIMEWIRIP